MQALQKKEEASYYYALGFLTLSGAVYRSLFLFQPVMHDEAVNYLYFAARPLSYGLSHYPYPNNHLFNTLLMHFTTRLWGNSPAVIRLPAFLAGVLLIPVTYLVIRRLYNARVALVAAAFIVPAGSLVSYSADARGFTIQALLFMLMVLAGSHLLAGAACDGG